MSGNAVFSLGIKQRGARNADLDGSAAHLQFFTMTLGFGAFPHASHHPHAKALGIRSKLDSWELVAQHVRDWWRNIWEYAGLIDNISVAIAKIF